MQTNVDQGVPRSEIDSKTTKFLFDMYKQKRCRSSGQKSNLTQKPDFNQSVPRLELVYRLRSP